ncbi:MAG TPA: hypothetical protein VM282_27260 [Acidimicrobiales bacterium]|nr:hypothetical protein [Acidimicrobiales bacterium]
MSISRRTVLAGLGVGAGAAAVGPGIASAAADAPRARAVAAAQLAPAAISAGLDYLILGGSSFISQNNTLFFQPGSTGVYAGTAIDAHFGLPVGSTLREVEIFASGDPGPLTAEVYRVPAGGTFVAPALATTPVAGGASATMTLNELTDGNSLYLIEVTGTTATLALQMARVGFIPPYRRVVTVNPQQRVYNSRDSVGVAKIVDNEERVIDLSSVVPAGATAAIVNLTTTLQSALGYLSLFPDGTTWPGTSSINYFTAQDIANSSIVAVSTDRKIKVRCGGGATHVIIDVTGYLI